MYSLYLASTQFPVLPEKIEMSYNGQNETVNLIDDGEVTFIKTPGLSEYSFSLLLPAVPYHFAVYPDNVFRPPTYYTELLEFLMITKSCFQLDIYRTYPDGREDLKAINATVTLESYTITENAEDGQDWIVKIKLKQYRPFGTKVLQLNATGTAYTIVRNDFKEPVRVTEVKEGETLESICRVYFGRDDREILDKIYKLNKAEMDKMNMADVAYIIENQEEWIADNYTSKGNAAALIDKAFLGGYNEKAADVNPAINWAQPYIMSLKSKGALVDWQDWVDNPDNNVSQAFLMALVDKITGGTHVDYSTPELDHWGRAHLNSLCDKGIIEEPEKWEEFDGAVLNQNTIGLVNKALNVTINKYKIYPGMRLLLTEIKII